MTIMTNFNIGDTAFTINPDTLKVKEFKVARIGTYTNKDGETTTTLYDDVELSYTGFDEKKCFHTEAELLGFITEKV